jgi:hypothetical protein
METFDVMKYTHINLNNVTDEKNEKTATVLLYYFYIPDVSGIAGMPESARK